MIDDKHLAWAKQHKKGIVKEYLTRSTYPSSDNPSVIFMAGLPGAGKTEFAKRLLPQLQTNVLHIDMDEIAEHIEDYNPKLAHKFRAGATVILERLYDKAIELKIDILLDGTFGNAKAIQNVERALKHGYSARIYFMRQHPTTAWNITKLREKIESRAISIEGFSKAYVTMLDNLDKCQEKFGDKVPITVVAKREDNSFKEINENVENITYYTEKALTEEDLIATLEPSKQS